MALLLYDADCGFCSTVASRLHLLGVTARVEPLQAVDLPALGVDPDRAQRDIPFVADDGTVSYGHRAWAQALRGAGPVLRPVGVAMEHPPLEPVARWVYAVVAANRHRLPGGTATCRLPDA